MEKRTKLDYKWLIVGALFLMVFVCLGFCSSNKGLYLTAITEAVGIPRGLFSFNDSSRYVASAVANLFFGILLARLGTRKLVAIGFVTTIASILLYAYAKDIVTFCIGGALLGIGLSFTTTTMASAVIRRWFVKDIGKYTGIVFAANGIGATVASLIATPLINEPGNPFGYRNSYLLVVAILVVTGIAVVAVLKDPSEPLATPAATTKLKKQPDVYIGVPFAQVRHKSYFYISAIIVLLTGLCLQGILGAYAAHLQDVGLTPQFIAAIVSISSLAMTASKILTGWMYDRFGLSVVMTMCQTAAIAAFLCLAFTDSSTIGIALTIAFAILYAVALPLETLLVPLLVNNFFGMIAYDKILGIFAAINYVGYALGAPLVNVCFDITGSYRPILIAFAALMLIITVVFRFVLRSVEKFKQQIFSRSE